VKTKVPRKISRESAVTFQLEASLKKKLEVAARRQERSVSFVVRSAVEKLLEGMKEDQAAA
jgi:predicted transcriptional regulator